MLGDEHVNKALNKNEFMEGMEDYKKQRKTIKKTRNISMTGKDIVELP